MSATNSAASPPFNFPAGRTQGLSFASCSSVGDYRGLFSKKVFLPFAKDEKAFNHGTERWCQAYCRLDRDLDRDAAFGASVTSRLGQDFWSFCFPFPRHFFAIPRSSPAPSFLSKGSEDFGAPQGVRGFCSQCCAFRTGKSICGSAPLVLARVFDRGAFFYGEADDG